MQVRDAQTLPWAGSASAGAGPGELPGPAVCGRRRRRRGGAAGARAAGAGLLRVSLKGRQAPGPGPAPSPSGALSVRRPMSVPKAKSSTKNSAMQARRRRRAMAAPALPASRRGYFRARSAMAACPLPRVAQPARVPGRRRRRERRGRLASPAVRAGPAHRECRRRDHGRDPRGSGRGPRLRGPS